MKLFTGILSVALIGTMINCSKSSDAGISIVGTWNGVSSGVTGCTNASSNSTSTYVCPATASTPCVKVTFSSNGNLITEYSSVINGSTSTSSNTGTYSVKGNSIAITTSSSGQSTTETDTFVVSGNTLTITSPKNSSTGCSNVIVLAK